MSKSYWKLTDEEYEFIKGEVIHIFEKYNIKCIPLLSLILPYLKVECSISKEKRITVGAAIRSLIER